MLAVQRYRPQKYTPGPDFAQFGDSLFAGHVKAAGRASNQASSNRRREFAAIHMDRLERAGLRPYNINNAESYSIHTPDGFESAANSSRVSRAPSEFGDPLSVEDAGSMAMAPSRASSERGDEESPPRPQVTEGGSTSSIGPRLAGRAMDLVRQGMANAAYNIPNDTAWVAGHASRLARAGVSNAARNIPNDTRRILDASTQLAKGGAELYSPIADTVGRAGQHLMSRGDDALESLRHFVDESSRKIRLRGKHTTFGPGRAYVQDHDDTDHVEMSYADVEGWMSSSQNKDELIHNLFKRQKFKDWIQKTYGSVDEGRMYRTLHEFTPEMLAQMLVMLDYH